jgi:hypothetical protein
MLPQPYRDLLGQTMLAVLPALNCQNLVNAVRPGSWVDIVPMNASYANAVPLVIEAADAQNWIRALVDHLATSFDTRPEFARVLIEIDRATTPRTVPDPFDEVLLDGGRPFVNRRPLRASLLDLTDQGGSSVLLIDGERQSGKKFSYYLINHVAPTKGFIVSRFPMARSPRPDELADDVLRRIGVERILPEIGNESAERWAEKLADKVYQLIFEKKSRRLFVFEGFPTTKLPDGTIVETPLPEGTASFIVRLARYSDEELRPYLRVVLIRFRGELPPELDDVALRDEARAFTPTDMVAAVMQVVRARGWPVSEAAVRERIDTYHQAAERTLNDRFRFLRGLLGQLASLSP